MAGQQLAGIGGTLAGYVIGNIVAPGIGGVIGGMAGGLIGSMLFARTKKPLISDIQASNSSYGNPIPILYGADRLTGIMIWCSQVKTSSSSVGKGGASGGQVQHYHQDSAWMFCEGPATLKKVWLDGKLFLDFTSGAPKMLTRHKFTVRSYDGTEGQLPDWLMAGWVGANVATQQPNDPFAEFFGSSIGITDATYNTVMQSGAAAPAYRGMAYLVFQGMDLANYGNRLPVVTAEWTSNGALEVLNVPLVNNTGDPFMVGGGTGGNSGGCDWGRQIAYTIAGDGTVRAYSLVSNTCIAVMPGSMLACESVLQNGVVHTFSPAQAPWGIAVGQNAKYVYVYNAIWVSSLDPNTLRKIDTTGVWNAPWDMGGRQVYTVDAVVVQTVGATGAHEGVLTFSNNGPVGYIPVDDHGGLGGDGIITNQTWPTLGDDSRYALGSQYYCAIGRNDELAGTCDLYIAVHFVFDDGSRVYKVSCDGLGVGDGTLVCTISPDFLGWPSANFYAASVANLWYDPADDTLVGCPVIVSLRTVVPVTTDVIVKISSSGRLIYQAPAPAPQSLGIYAPNATPLTLGLLNWSFGGASYCIFDISTATYTLQTIANGGAGNQHSYSGEIEGTMVRNLSDGSWAMQYQSRVNSADPFVADIITSLCARVGLTADMIDVSRLSQTVTGYAVRSQTSAGAAILDLCHVFQIDMVESDWTLKFVPRGGAVVANITQSQLSSTDTNNPAKFWEARAAQQAELPLEVTVKYRDFDLDFQPGSAYGRRIAKPVPTVFSKRRTTVDLPIVTTQTTARHLAENWLYQLWSQRYTYQTEVSPEFLWLDPTDVVTVTMDDGSSFTLRAVAMDVGADLAVRLDLASEDETVYQVSTTPPASYSTGPQSLPSSVFANLLQFNVPLLRDEDAPSSAALSRVYFAAGSSNANYLGGVVYSSTDTVTWPTVGTTTNAAIWGYTTTALGDTPTRYATDWINTVTVAFQQGARSLSSAAYIDLMNGANAFLLGREVVQASTITDNSDGTVTFSGLIRGQRGTDWATGTHAINDLVVYLAAGGVGAGSIGLNEINQTELWKLVPPASTLLNAPTASFAYLGYDLMPYAPVHVKGVYSGSNIVLTWVRQTRIGAALKDGTDTAPLSETSESYDVEILNAAATAVLRTFAAVTSPTQTYLAAQITSDFGSAPTTLWVKVYQNSSVVGRGFSFLRKLDLVGGIELAVLGDPPPTAVIA